MALVFCRYTRGVTDTTIKVDSQVRDRLAALAADQGTTIRNLVEQLAAGVPTRSELAQRQADATAYVIEHLRPDFGDKDLAAGERLWQSLQTGIPAGAGSAGTGTGGRAA
jgi:hypothetical protein